MIWQSVKGLVLYALSHLLVVALVVLLLYVSVAYTVERYQHRAERLEAAVAADKVEKEHQKELGAVQAQLVNRIKIDNGTLAQYVKQAKAKPVTAIRNTVTVKTSEVGHVTASGGQSAWDDEHHRFHLELPAGPLTRNQLFKFDGVIVNNGGKYTFYKGNFREFDPVTKEEIPVTGVTTTSDIQVVEEAAPVVPHLHLRYLVAADQRAAIGGGVQFLNISRDRFALAAVALYSKNDNDLRGGLALGWRVPHTNATIGPYAAISSKGTQVYGVAATLELSR